MLLYWRCVRPEKLHLFTIRSTLLCYFLPFLTHTHTLTHISLNAMCICSFALPEFDKSNVITITAYFDFLVPVDAHGCIEWAKCGRAIRICNTQMECACLIFDSNVNGNDLFVRRLCFCYFVVCFISFSKSVRYVINLIRNSSTVLSRYVHCTYILKCECERMWNWKCKCLRWMASNAT